MTMRTLATLMLLSLFGCASPWERVGPAAIVNVCPICGWPVELQDTELHYFENPSRKQVLCWYVCFSESCANVVVTTNWYALREPVPALKSPKAK